MVTFRCYSGSVETQSQEAWCGALPPEFNGEVDAELHLLRLHRTLDDERFFKPLRGRCAGLTEIRIAIEVAPDDARIEHENPQRGRRRLAWFKIDIRVLGFGAASDFVLLYAFRKRGGPDYGPACHAALNRKDGVKRDGGRARPCRFPFSR